MVLDLYHVQPGIYHTVEPAVEVVQGVVRVWVQVLTLRGGYGVWSLLGAGESDLYWGPGKNQRYLL